MLELGVLKCLDTQERFRSGRVWARERLHILEWRPGDRMKRGSWYSELQIELLFQRACEVQEVEGEWL